MLGGSPWVAAALAAGLACCAERQPSVSGETAVLESGRPPIAVTTRQERGADGQLMHEVLVRAERGSESWFQRSGHDLQLEVGTRRLRLTTLPGGLGARWNGGPGVLSWSARDGSAGLRVELADLRSEVERPPGFESLRKTGLIEVAVPVGPGP